MLTGGQVARPSAWLWSEPDTSLLSVASSRIDTLAVLRQAALALSGAGIYWWLGGLRRGAANSAAEAQPVASLR